MIGAPGFYAEHLGAGFATHDELLARLARPAAALAGRFDLFRGLALGLLARRGPGIALIRRERGTGRSCSSWSAARHRRAPGGGLWAGSGARRSRRRCCAGRRQGRRR